MQVQMIKARFAACIADGLQTVRAEVSMWACASGPGVARWVSATLRC